MKLNTVLLFSLLLISRQVWAETTLSYNVSGSSSWYPYYISETADRPGILGELVPQIFARAGIKLKKKKLPPKRTNSALETGQLDFDVVSPSWFEHQDLGELFVQSEPLFPIKEHIIVLNENVAQWQSISKIKNQQIGTVHGYLYHDDDQFMRIDFKSERELVMALKKQRVAAAISGDLTALYWAKELNIGIGLAALHSDGELVVRLRKEHEQLLPQINQAIAVLKDNGVIDAIVDKYVSRSPTHKQVSDISLTY